MLGDYEAARKHYLRARDLDTLRFRADSRINDINRDCSIILGAELVDADAIFAKESPNGIIGSELVYEHVHMTPEGNYLLARAMFQQIASKLPAETGQTPSLLSGGQASDVPSQVECEQLLAFTAHDRLRIAQEMLQRLQKPPFTNQLNHSDQVLRLTIKAGSPEESPDETGAEYQWAIRKRPDDRDPALQALGCSSLITTEMPRRSSCGCPVRGTTSRCLHPTERRCNGKVQWAGWDRSERKLSRHCFAADSNSSNSGVPRNFAHRESFCRPA